VEMVDNLKKFVKEKYEIDKLTNQLLAIYECRMDK
jgi:hypothetical protein